TMIKVIAGVNPADSGEVRWEGKPVTIHKPSDATGLGIATVYQDLALCDNLDVVANLFLGQEVSTTAVLDEIAMEKRASELLDTLSVRIPSVRIPVAALSGGQRQSVAIARSLLGEPKVVLLDEPTAALGVAQTAQVLDLIERLRDRGHGVVLISHNLADVKAVADRVVVLRLGRNAGDFDMATATQEQIVQAITGASDNAVSRRQARADRGDLATTGGREAGQWARRQRGPPGRRCVRPPFNGTRGWPDRRVPPVRWSRRSAGGSGPVSLAPGRWWSAWSSSRSSSSRSTTGS